jgi:tetratricopeptide (TPR) repeat protein
MSRRSIAILSMVFALSRVPLVAADEHAADDSEQSRKQRARALWDEGARRYDLGDFDGAADLLYKAYQVWPYPAILFNLCQAYRQKSDYKKAIFYCKSYVRNAPEATNRSAAEDLTSEMEATLERQEQTNEKPPTGVEHPPGELRAVSPSADPWYSDPVAWTITGVGIVAIATGGGFLFWASDLESQSQAAPDMRDELQLHEEAGTKRTIGALALAGGTVVTLAGAYLLYRTPPARQQTRLVLAPIGVMLVGSF